MSKFLANSPMLCLPFRRTDDVDFETGMSAHIRTVYQESPSNYATEISTLYRFRQDVRGAGSDVVGRDILYRYYKQIDLLDLRFPINEANVRVLFTWYDAFSNKAISQYSLAFEKASILFNLGAVCCTIGASQNRYEESGLKAACKYFQVSAGFFSLINENFLHAPSVDMSRDSLKALIELCLAQAQECFIEKVYADDKSCSLKAKLAAHAALGYANAKELLSHPAVAEQFPREWLDLSSIKSCWMEALSHAEMAKSSEQDGRYGVAIAYLQAANAYAKDAHKLASKFQSEHGSWNPAGISAVGQGLSDSGKTRATASGSGVAAALVTNTQAVLSRVTQELKTAVKDNEFIYHEEVPAREQLPVVDKLSAVKPLKMADLFSNGEEDLAKVAGPDIFAKLVPISVHQSASVYSKTKDDLVRKYAESASDRDKELEAALCASNARNLIKQFEADALGSEQLELPLSIRAWHIQVSKEEVQGELSTLGCAEKFAELFNSCTFTLSQVSIMMEKEQAEHELALKQFPEEWTQTQPSVVFSSFAKHIKELKTSLADAQATDKALVTKAEGLKLFVEVFGSTLSVQEVESKVRSLVMARVKPSQNLLDMPVENTGESEESRDRLKELVQRLEELKRERANFLLKMKETSQNDSITGSLMQKNLTEAAVFETELKKYEVFTSSLDANFKQQRSLIPEVGVQVQNFVKRTPSLQAFAKMTGILDQLVSDWTVDYNVWVNLRQSLRQGLDFYKSVQVNCQKLEVQVGQVCASRAAERSQRLEQLSSKKLKREQELLQQKISGLQLDAAGAPLPVPSYPTFERLESATIHAPANPAYYTSAPSVVPVLPPTFLGTTFQQPAIGVAHPPPIPPKVLSQSGSGDYRQVYTSPTVSNPSYPQSDTFSNATKSNSIQQPPPLMPTSYNQYSYSIQPQVPSSYNIQPQIPSSYSNQQPYYQPYANPYGSQNPMQPSYINFGDGSHPSHPSHPSQPDQKR